MIEPALAACADVGQGRPSRRQEPFPALNDQRGADETYRLELRKAGAVSQEAQTATCLLVPVTSVTGTLVSECDSFGGDE